MDEFYDVIYKRRFFRPDVDDVPAGYNEYGQVVQIEVQTRNLSEEKQGHIKTAAEVFFDMVKEILNGDGKYPPVDVEEAANRVTADILKTLENLKGVSVKVVGLGKTGDSTDTDPQENMTSPGNSAP